MDEILKFPMVVAVIAATAHKILTSVATWDVIKEKRQATQKAADTTNPTDHTIASKIKKPRKTFSEWAELSCAVSSIFAMCWLLWLFFSVPRSDPRLFMVFLALLVVIAIRPNSNRGS